MNHSLKAENIVILDLLTPYGKSVDGMVTLDGVLFVLYGAEAGDAGITASYTRPDYHKNRIVIHPDYHEAVKASCFVAGNSEIVALHSKGHVPHGDTASFRGIKLNNCGFDQGHTRWGKA